MIIDITGRILFSVHHLREKSRVKIPWNNFSGGTYFITIQNNEERVFFQQIVK